MCSSDLKTLTVGLPCQSLPFPYLTVATVAGVHADLGRTISWLLGVKECQTDAQLPPLSPSPSPAPFLWIGTEP